MRAKTGVRGATLVAASNPLQKMAVNRIKGAFAIPKKGETFELRAGLVYVARVPEEA